MKLTIQGYGTIGFLPEVPDHLLEPKVPGAKALWVDENFGCVVLQEAVAAHHTLTHYIYHANQEITIQAVAEKGVWGVLIVLQNHINHIKYTGEAQAAGSLKQGQFHFYNAMGVNGSFSFKKENTYHLLILALPEAFIASIPGYDSALHLLAQKVPVACSTIQVLDAMEELLLQPFSQDLVVVLLEQLLLASQHEPLPRALTEQKIEDAYLVRDLIRNDVQQHFTIPAIAKQTGINEYDLKENFRKVFGMGMYEYLMYERMKLAGKLVTETHTPLKLIAQRTGYRHYGAFVTAFTKRFHATPGQLRKKLLSLLLWISWDELPFAEMDFLFC